MPTVILNDESFPCATAIKGEDYILLLDEGGDVIASFEGIKDFSAFFITDGDWIIPTPNNECHVAVIKDDGTIGKGNYRCSDILSKVLPADCYGTELPTNDFTAGRIFFLKLPEETS